MSKEETAIEMVYDVVETLRDREDGKQALILQACVDALYGDRDDEEPGVDFTYLETFNAIRFIAEKHGLAIRTNKENQKHMHARVKSLSRPESDALLIAIVEALYPEGDIGHEWSPDTVHDVSARLHEAHIQPGSDE